MPFPESGTSGAGIWSPGVVITASDNVALWWMSLSRDVTAMKLHGTVLRNGKTATTLRRAAPKGHEKRLKTVPDFWVDKSPDGTLQDLYSASQGGRFQGKPYRYDTNNTTHIWFLPPALHHARKTSARSNKSGSGKKRRVASKTTSGKGKRYAAV